MAHLDLVKGTLGLLILRTLELEPRHGVAIADRIAQTTRGTFQVKAGSLFPALHRLEQDGAIAGEWTVVDGRRLKTYRLTAAGRRQLAAATRDWARVVEAMRLVLEPR
ncbi:MAG: PadR family transcriptional regulator [Vicinamibacterales bacterium]